jgi:hypothetical protein
VRPDADNECCHGDGDGDDQNADDQAHRDLVAGPSRLEERHRCGDAEKQDEADDRQRDQLGRGEVDLAAGAI